MFIIGGLGLLGEATIYAISLLIVGICLLPQVKKYILNKINISGKVYGIILFILGAISMPSNTNIENNITENKINNKIIDNKKSENIVASKKIIKEETKEDKLKKEKK